MRNERLQKSQTESQYFKGLPLNIKFLIKEDIGNEESSGR